jgi:hypothetical protein
MSSLPLLPLSEKIEKISADELLRETQHILRSEPAQLAFTIVLESLKQSASEGREDSLSLLYKCIFETLSEASTPTHSSYIKKLNLEELMGYEKTVKFAQAFISEIWEISQISHRKRLSVGLEEPEEKRSSCTPS